MDSDCPDAMREVNNYWTRMKAQDKNRKNFPPRYSCETLCLPLAGLQLVSSNSVKPSKFAGLSW